MIIYTIFVETNLDPFYTTIINSFLTLKKANQAAIKLADEFCEKLGYYYESIGTLDGDDEVRIALKKSALYFKDPLVITIFVEPTSLKC